MNCNGHRQQAASSCQSGWLRWQVFTARLMSATPAGVPVMPVLPSAQVQIRLSPL